ncbi:CHAT domain-containing protein [Mycena capillaripes]|nr:CHAT domain-containing protein [Mycena capillaripes]
MQMFAQLIIDKDIFLQTVSVDAEFSQKSWKLQPECKIPEHSNTFLLAILRHSKTQGTRLLGYTEVTRDEAIVSAEDKTRLCLDVVKVNHDGPLLKLRANISVVESPTTKPSNGIHPLENEAHSVRSDFRTTEAHLKQMGENSNRKSLPDALELWVMHERILFLPSSSQRAELLAQLGDICSAQWKVSHAADQLSQAICAYEDAVRDDPENVAYRESLDVAQSHRILLGLDRAYCDLRRPTSGIIITVQNEDCTVYPAQFQQSGWRCPPTFPLLSLPNILYASHVEVIAMTYPHSDLPPDTQIFGQLIVQKQVVQKTEPTHRDPSQTSWKLESGFEIPTRGIRLLGYSKPIQGEALLAGANNISLELTKVNSDGPSLVFMAIVSVTEDYSPMEPYIAAHNSKIKTLANSLKSQLETILSSLEQVEEKLEKEICPSTEELGSLHRNILFLPVANNRRGRLLHLCGNIALNSWTTSRTMEQLNKAISAYGDAARDVPENTAYLGDHGIALYHRFEELGDVNDINEAVAIQKEAIGLTPDEDTNKPAMLNNLGNSLELRFQRFGGLLDLNESISTRRNAVQLTPDGHPTKLAWLSYLGNVLQLRFQRLGDLDDLNESISKHKTAVELTPDGHPSKFSRCSDFGNALQLRFERLGDLCALDECISNHKIAVGLTSEDHLSKPIVLHNLGSSLQARFEQFRDLKDLNEAISRQRDALKLTSKGQPNKFQMLNNLGHCLQLRFEELKDLDDLNEFISNHRDAVHLTPDGHFDKAETLNNFGHGLFLRFERFQNPEDIQETIKQYISAACSTTGPTQKRFHAASKWAQHAQAIQHYTLLDVYQKAMDLLPELTWLGLSITDRHYLLIKSAPVMREAAAGAISSGQPAKALEWLEQGRAVIWGQLLNLRSPVDTLKQKAPQLAHELILCSAQLEGVTTRKNNHAPHSGTQPSATSIIQRAHENAHKRDLLLKKIRELEGFRRFLLPKTIYELSMAAQRGPVIFLNASEKSCDALILIPGRRGEVMHVALSEFTPEHVKNLTQSLEHLIPSMGRGDVDRLHGHREGESGNLEDGLAHILSELWLRLVKPVLDALVIMTPAKDNLQRIWWCPTGPFTSLPIHAAGPYGRDDVFGSKLSDYVISSYTPSLAALIQGFRPRSEQQEQLQLLAVAQPSALGRTCLPGTRAEIKRIQESAQSKIPVCSLVAHEATLVRVEEEIMKSSWVHFACHGVQDRLSPTESALLLDENSQLTLSRIIELNLPHADLAFLSACQTATGDKKLQEESHLAAGMLLAGYRGVIATMWSIMDNDAPQVAEDVYKHLFKTSPPDPTRAAEALHLAVRNLREGSEGRKSLFHWVPFIHVGV